jgi:thiosulfate/3-mercaptopyruvate sulfurtransferase
MEDLIVSPETVADAGESIRPVDVREAWEYDGIGHLPGAVSIPFDTFRSGGEGPEGMLPPATDWAALLGAAGIDPQTRLVAYDDTHGVFAARFVVTALLYGHGAVHLLDGDYSAWSREHRVATEPTDISETTYPTPTLEPGFLVDAEAVTAAADSEDSVLVDTRSPAEFDEGHIEGAVNVDWVELVDEETRGLRPAEEVRALLADRGITPDHEVLLYCNTARRISHTFVVLRQLGFANLRFYEGSLTDWRAAGRPLVSE